MKNLKNKQYLYKTIKLQVLPKSVIHILISDNADKALNKIKIECENKYPVIKDGYDGLAYYRSGVNYFHYFIILRTDAKTKHCIHEAVHIKNFLFKTFDIKNDLNNDEYEAYLVDFIANKAVKTLKKWKKKQH